MRFFLAFFFLYISTGVSSLVAQELLTLEDAIQNSLSKNFEIRISEKDTLFSDNNITLGNAGFLPTLGVQGRVNGSVNNSRQVFLDGRNQEVNAAQTRQQNAGLALNWVLFDGMRMFNNYKILQLTHQSSRLDLRLTVESVLQSIFINYNEIILQKKALEVLNQNLQVSRERLAVAFDRYELGAFSKADWLRARVDFNNDSAQVINQEQLLFSSKASLNQLMGLQPENKYKVSDTILVDFELDYANLKSSLKNENSQILASRKLQEIRQMEVELAQGNQLPTLSLDAGYNFFNSNSDAGFVISNRNRGFTYGLTFFYPIFAGSNRKRETQNTRIRVAQAEEQLQNTRLQAETDFEISYQNYLLQKDLLLLERENIEVVRENLEISIERYKLGLVSAIEFRDAQLIALQAESRLITLQYQLKLSEINLLRVSGALVKEWDN
jgi:outer membrane protein TolC